MLKKALTLVMQSILPIAVIFIAYQGYAYLQATKPKVKQRQAKEKVWPVNVKPVKFSNFQPDLRLFGQTVSGRRVDLRALVSGKVIETSPDFKEGAVIKKGDTILKIDPFNYEGALTEANANLAEANAKVKELQVLIKSETQNLARAKEQLDLAERDLTRALPLAKKGTVSKQVADQRRLLVSQRNQSLEQIANNISMREAQLTQQQAAIARLKWRVAEAKRNLKDTTLRAPFDAYVLSVGAELGRLVGANDSIVTLLDKNWVEARFTLSDNQYGRILAAEGSVINRDVKVKWFVGEKPLTYFATIERVNAEISSEDGGVTVFARLQNPNTPSPIRAGAFVEITMPDRQYDQVARLPRTALYGQNTIYIVKDGRLSKRAIEVVGATNNEVLVRGNIAENDQVITTRLAKAGEGVKVRTLTKKDDTKNKQKQRNEQTSRKQRPEPNEKNKRRSDADDAKTTKSENWSRVGTAPGAAQNHSTLEQ